MSSLDRASPALKEILLKIYRARKPMEVDHHLYELGSVEYHVQSSASEPHIVYLSISTPLLSQGVMLSYGLSPYTIEMVKSVPYNIVEIVEPAKQGYQLTMRLNFANIPPGKDSLKIITEISTMQAVILSLQLKEMLQTVNSLNASQGICKPIKLVYHPREPFYVIRQPQMITAVFPMRFKEHSDVIIATAFFQELMDVGSSEEFAKVPPCNWSPIPPPELRGEPFKDLSTNGGFVSFEISSCHVEGEKLDKTVWILLNFYAHVKYHVKCTKGFIQRRLRSRLEILVQVLEDINSVEGGEIEKVQGCRFVKKLGIISKSKILRGRCGDFTRKIKRIRFRIKIHGFGRLRQKWLRIPKFSSPMGYTKLD
ncbi:actin-related protein 2/3 complex subunit 2B isoform X2 [Carica papaya]|uniref:actin-related protein 2/3 complex subunit 2B isoform X2 n=1 Tax=Carica papaya TaxID=3649 RepID=UPI000B8CDA58|nr:actin-related protein 2/3 complex subunit 2B isoform X2 [Carica papaya]